jgi:hypothetical protein
MIQEWFKYLDLPAVRKIKVQNRYNIDETGLIEGFGVNGLYLGSSATKTALRRSPDSRI